MQGLDRQKRLGLRRGRVARRLSCWLALVPFVLFSLIVAGTMPVRDDVRGGVTLVLCAGDGPVEMVVTADGSMVPAQKLHQHCDWAPLSQPLLQGTVAAVPRPWAEAVPLALAPDPVTPLRPAEVLSPSARGPPALT